MNVAVIVLAGDYPGSAVLEDLPDDRLLIAADGGLDHALRLGLAVDVVVGDMDSVSPASLASIPKAHQIRHPTDKNATDLELSVDFALERGGEHLIVVGGAGGRLDHVLGNASVLCANRYAALDIDWISSAGRATVVRSHLDLHGVPGEVVSLIPMGGDAQGVSTEGLRWRLEGATVRFGTGLGLSNEFGAPVARVSLTGGVLFVIQPQPS